MLWQQGIAFLFDLSLRNRYKFPNKTELYQIIDHVSFIGLGFIIFGIVFLSIVN